MVVDILFNWEFRRTYFSDDGYGAAGRALAYVQSFEGDCRALNTLLRTRAAAGTDALSLSDDESVQRFVAKIHKLLLHQHLEQVVQYYELRELVLLFDRARESRNLIAHELLIGAQFDLETNLGRAQMVRTAADAIRNVAQAHLIVLVLMSTETHVDLPNSRFLGTYVDRVTRWVSVTDDG